MTITWPHYANEAGRTKVVA